MFEERIESDIEGNRLILEKSDLNNVGYKARMLIENHIPGFLECSIICTDGKDSYVYDITSKTSLYNIYEHEEMNYKMLYGFIESVVCGLESAGEYMLPAEHLMLDPRHIFVENETGRIYWCYYPGCCNTLKDGMNELAEYILGKADHKDDAATALAYDLYKQVVNEDYTLRKLLIQHSAMTDSVTEDERYEMDNILIEDDTELYPPDENDAPGIPKSGKVIITVCLSIVLFLSGFVFTAVLYKNSQVAGLLKLNEMRILICVTEAMAMLLPVLITAKWIDQSRRFRKLICMAGGYEEKDLYRQVCFGRDCLNQGKSMI